MKYGSSINNKYSFPDFNVSDKEKNEEYHKQALLAITARSVNSNYENEGLLMDELYRFYNSDHTGEEFKFLQEAEDGSVLPAKWISFDRIRVKINLLVGELIERGYEINVEAVNKEAKVRKLEEKEKARVRMKMREIVNSMEEEFGLPLTNQNEFTPDDEQQLDEYYKYNYKEKAEIIMESAIKWISKKNRWDYTRIALFRDILITGRCVTKTELIDSIPTTRRIDPRLLIFDRSATDDFLSDSAYFGEVRYMSVPEIAERYGLDKEEIKQIKAGYRDTNFATTDMTSGLQDLLSGKSLGLYKEEDHEFKTMVVSAVWVDYKPISHKISKDKYGHEHVKEIKPGTLGDDIRSTKIKIWRKATLISGCIVKDWGEIKNQNRNMESLYDTDCPYKVLIPNYVNGRGVSITEQLSKIQKLKDITLYNLQLAMSRAGAKGFVYDIAQLPDEWDIHEAIKYLKTAGIAFIDSAKDGGGNAAFNQFQQFDMTLSQSVQWYIQINAMLDREMDAVSGVNEARQGIIQAPSQTVGVTQTALMQSNLTTRVLFELFNQYSSSIFNHQAGLVKLAWKDKEKFSFVIGDTGIDFISNEIDVSMDDYSVFVESLPPILEDKQALQQMVAMAINSQQIDLIDAIKILKTKDMKQALLRFEREFEKKRQEQMQAAQQQMQQQMMAQQENQNSRNSALVESSRVQGENAMALENTRHQNEIQKILAEARLGK